jgi:hypothetical protein
MGKSRKPEDKSQPKAKREGPTCQHPRGNGILAPPPELGLRASHHNPEHCHLAEHGKTYCNAELPDNGYLIHWDTFKADNKMKLCQNCEAKRGRKVKAIAQNWIEKTDGKAIR